MLFSDIIGQDAIKERLIATVKENRISHARLFLGKPGYGTLPLAIAYAQYILCTGNKDNDSCGTCSSCLKANKLIHPDLHFSFPVNTNPDIVKSNPTSEPFMPLFRELHNETHYFDLNDWHLKSGLSTKQTNINVYESALIMRNLALKAFESEYKITIIWMAERMNVQSANKLLKILEEPPAKTLFFLVAESEENILATILSRTQLIKTGRISSTALKEALAKEYDVSPDRASSIAHLADGDYIQAKRLMESTQEELFNKENFSVWMRLCFRASLIELVDWAEKMGKCGREQLKNFLEYGLHIFRESAIINAQADELKRLEGDELNFAKNFAPFVNQANIMLYMELFNDMHYAIERNANAKIVLLSASFKIAKYQRLKPDQD